MISFRGESGWKPRWAYHREPYVVLIARSGVDGVTVCWDPGGNQSPKQFVAEFLDARVRSLPEREFESEVNYLYVVLRRGPEFGDINNVIGPRTPIAEFGYGAPPSSPEDWPLMSLREVLRSTTSLLLRQTGTADSCSLTHASGHAVED